MEASPEFREFGMRFIGDIDGLLAPGEDIIDYLIGGARGEERVRLRNFIDRLLQPDVSDDELLKLWRSVNNEIYFRTANGMREMLRGARDRLHEKRAPSRDPRHRPRGKR